MVIWRVDVIGQGSFCTVFHASYKGKDVSMKVIKSQNNDQIKRQSYLIIWFIWILYNFIPYPYLIFVQCVEPNISVPCTNFYNMWTVSWFPKIVGDITDGVCFYTKMVLPIEICSQIPKTKIYMENVNKAIKENPVVIKLTDFGESQSSLLQSRTIAATRTKKLWGTLRLIVPKQLPGSLRIYNMRHSRRSF